MTMTLREEAIKMHLENNGKIAVATKVPIATRHDCCSLHPGRS